MSDIQLRLNFGSIPYVKGVNAPPDDSSILVRSAVVHLGSFGAIGNGKFATAEATQIPFPLDDGIGMVGRRGIVTLQVTQNDYPLFTGAVDATDTHKGSGVFEFDTRDNCFVLQERLVEPHTEPANETIETFITKIVKSAELEILKIASPTNPNGTPITMGTYYGNATGSHFFSSPEPAWGLIQRLAKDCGYVAYCTNSGSFYFGPRNRGQVSGGGVSTQSLTWAQDVLHNTLHIRHELQRHAAFVVVVNSSSKHSKKPIIGTCAYINPQLAQDASRQLIADPTVPGSPLVPRTAANAGMYVGLSVDDIQEGYGPIPIYDHFISGLDTAQANMRALGTAREIAAQEVVLTFKLVGDEFLMEVGQPFTLSGTGDPLVEGEEFVVVHSSYEFNVEGNSGFTQEITAWKADELQVSGIEGVSTPQPPDDY
jgi:hypothetical protein